MDLIEERRQAIQRASRRLAAAAFGGPEWDAACEAMDELTRASEEPVHDRPASATAPYPGRGGYAALPAIDDRT